MNQIIKKDILEVIFNIARNDESLLRPVLNINLEDDEREPYEAELYVKVLEELENIWDLDDLILTYNDISSIWTEYYYELWDLVNYYDDSSFSD